MADRTTHFVAGLLLAGGAVALGGVWAVLLGFAALLVVADAMIPLPAGPAVEAERAFDQVVRGRRVARWLRRDRRLDVLEEAHPWVDAAQRRERGVLSIPLDSVTGTVEPLKARQFDADWRPDVSARDRWKPLWLGRRSGSPIPPVSVYRVGDTHWLRDGHHRASVARHQGAPTLEAEVVELVR